MVSQLDTTHRGGWVAPSLLFEAEGTHALIRRVTLHHRLDQRFSALPIVLHPFPDGRWLLMAEVKVLRLVGVTQY